MPASSDCSIDDAKTGTQVEERHGLREQHGHMDRLPGPFHAALCIRVRRIRHAPPPGTAPQQRMADDNPDRGCRERAPTKARALATGAELTANLAPHRPWLRQADPTGASRASLACLAFVAAGVTPPRASTGFWDRSNW
jgi:hypothetical protein